MQVVVLAGGRGLRLSEETRRKPKALVEIGGRPILWHVMKIYSAWGFTEFVICCGYRGHMIKEFFSHYFLHANDVTFDMSSNSLEILSNKVEPWRVTLVDTGEDAQTGERLRRVRPHLKGDRFCLTYCDCLSDVDLRALLAFHEENRKLVTVTAVRPPARFGVLDMEGASVKGFHEKPDEDRPWINGGFFVVDVEALDAIQGEDSIWEREPLSALSAKGEVAAYLHNGFWRCMDTLNEKMGLEAMCASGNPPWAIRSTRNG